MTKEEILFDIKNSVESHDSFDVSDELDSRDQYDDDEIENAWSKYYGMHLYKSSFLISSIQEYILEVLIENDVDINKSDLFDYMEKQDLFSVDYTTLHEDIMNQITDADYGQRYFIEGDYSSTALNDKLEELFNEFENLFED